MIKTLESIQKYVDEIKAKSDADWKLNGYTLPEPTFSINQGKRFAKIIRKSTGSRSVHCFVEIVTGDIYKAAGWNAPAKGVRGNIHNENKPLTGWDYYR